MCSGCALLHTLTFRESSFLKVRNIFFHQCASLHGDLTGIWLSFIRITWILLLLDIHKLFSGKFAWYCVFIFFFPVFSFYAMHYTGLYNTISCFPFLTDVIYGFDLFEFFSFDIFLLCWLFDQCRLLSWEWKARFIYLYIYIYFFCLDLFIYIFIFFCLSKSHFPPFLKIIIQ